ncbi:hypothetical protein OUZ56_028139 [Daphnia magna]|uniref:Uncharacterized protein n=1 Tax=Daphnia magna TaxID=35525 RepID=A0ABR0B2Z8_9CRUS|nr:hypothetical protein OUZ56_028139 [Daphnia magna]
MDRGKLEERKAPTYYVRVLRRIGATEQGDDVLKRAKSTVTVGMDPKTSETLTNGSLDLEAIGHDGKMADFLNLLFVSFSSFVCLPIWVLISRRDPRLLSVTSPLARPGHT